MKGIGFALVVCLCSVSLGVPTFQVAIPSGVYDGDTWIASNSGSFDLTLVGAYGPNTQSLSDCVLIASVPKGETGTISVSGATLKTDSADVHVLTNVSGNNAYGDKSIFPDTFNNHDVFKSDVSNFVLFNVGSFDNVGAVHNYQDPVTTAGSGQERNFAVDVTGFSTVHFDMYGYETNLLGKKKIATSWDINPGSHDATWNGCQPPVVPVPGAVLLTAVGTAVMAGFRKFSTI